MERNKDELSKEKTSNKILNEEKDMNNKEFERLLEKYDRYFHFLSIFHRYFQNMFIQF